MKVAIVKTVSSKAKPIATYICKKVGPKLPEILLGTGIAAIGSGTVLACVKSAKEAPKIIADTKGAILDIRDSSNDEEVKQEVTKAYFSMAIDMAKMYAVPVAIIAGGIGCIITSHNIQRARIVAIGSAYNTLLASFNQYRARVEAAEGKDADKRYLYGEEEATVKEEKVGKNGKVSEKEKTVTVLGGGDEESLYHWRFDWRSPEWCKDVDYNLAFIMAQQRIFNNKLQSEGFVFLDEVFQALGRQLDETCSNAKLVGWKLGMGDDFIDFGIYSPNADLEHRATNITALKEGNNYQKDYDSEVFMNGYDNAIWLDFNCDGIIIDKI